MRKFRCKAHGQDGLVGAGFEVEVGQAFQAGTRRFGDAVGPSAFEAVVDLHGQDLT